MSEHQNHPHLDAVKTHFISGEPGTTGREPFADTIPIGQGHSHSEHSGTGLTGGNHSGLTSGQHSGTGLSGGNSSSLTGNRDHSSSGGLTGASHHNDASTGVLGSTHHDGHQHNSQYGSGAQTGAVGIAGHGLTGLSHAPHDQSATVHGTGHIGDSPSSRDTNLSSTHNNNTGEKKGIVEKVKEALPIGGSSSKDHSTSNTHSSTGTGTHGTHTNTNTTDYHPSSSTTGAGSNRDVVDKINDALPGTPAKTGQNYGTSHNPVTQGDHSVGGRTEYGAGNHGTSGLAGAGAGTGLAGAALAGSDRHNDNVTGSGHHNATSGLTGSSHHDNTSSGLSSAAHNGKGLGSNTGSGLTGSSHHDTGSGFHDNVHDDTSQRAPGKSSGGLSGLLATSDKDFTGRERQGQGAYADTDGLYKLNSSGPKGNSALTGREGNLENNPVARAKSRETGTTTSTGAPHTTGTHADETHPEKKGLLAKIKDAVL